MCCSNLSLTDSCTIKRDTAEQFSPIFQNAPLTTCSATKSRCSASSSTTAGFLPPHSSTTFFKLLSAAYRKKRRPVSVEPVKLTISTSLCRPNGSPTASPVPGNTWNTPRGTPASQASSATRNAVNEVCSAGFTITEFPAANAGAIFQANINKGKFQGNTAPTTPIGSRTIMATASLPVGAV